MKDSSYLYMFAKTVLMLGIVIAVMLLLLWLFKKYMNGAGGRFGRSQSSPIKVLSTSFLGPKKSLSIVDVAGEVLVLGITAESITCLATLDREDALEEIKKYKTDRTKPGFSFFRK